MWGWILLQVWLGGSWGTSSSTWQSYGTELRKSSGLNALRAFCQVLNGATIAGLPYQDDNPRAAGWGDSLISACISTENAPALYVHFAYQRGGLMDPPENNDTLRLWGLQADGTWQILWDTVGTGQADSFFFQRTLRLEGTAWRHPCLRLKWTTYGSLYGAYDNWLIAYTAVTADSILPGAYWHSIPRTYWGTYGILPAYLATRVRDSILTTFLGPPGENVSLTHEQESTPFSRTVGLTGNIDTLRWPPPQATPADTLYRLSLRYTLLPTGETWTDTTAIGPWLGYDDDEMEQGYGLSVANRPFLQVFELDTLVAIDRVALRFFPIPTQVGKPFQLGIWLLDAGSEPVYLRFHRVALDSVGGGFVTYPLDTLLWVQGQVGVGLIQADNLPLGIGWDASYRGKPVVYRDSAGSWVPSRKMGCLMVRLGLVPQSVLSLVSPKEGPSPWRLAPVPVRAGALLEVLGAYPEKLTVWTPAGLYMTDITAPLTQAPAQPGLYLVRDRWGRTQKLLVLP
jgi:hypothetical protein